MWHQTLPQFVSETEGVEEIGRLIEAHVRLVAGDHPEVDEWDLYNEAPGALKPHTPADNPVRRWMEGAGGAGPATERLMAVAREANPKARYALNHYDGLDPAYHEQIRYLLSRGVDFGAIGIQSHMHRQGDIWTEQRMWEMLESYAGYGRPIQLTEVTVLSSEPFTDWRELQAFEKWLRAARREDRPGLARPSTPEGEDYQARYARDFYTLAFSHPSVDAIIWWSLSDMNDWRGSAGGLLDAQGEPKPVYDALAKLIKEEWWTIVEAEADAEGRVSFRGFYGDYRLTVPYDDGERAAEFSLRQGGAAEQRLTVAPAGATAKGGAGGDD